jgi:hypothetical protein
MQATLTAVGFLSAVAAWVLGGARLWLIGGLLLGLVIPVTLLVILPTNRQLLNPHLRKDSAEAGQLLDRWNRLHAARSVLGFVSFVIFVVTLSRGAR